MFRLVLLAILFIAKLSADSVTIPLSDCSCDPCQCCCVIDPYITIGAGAVFPCKNSHIRGDSSSVLFTPTIPGTSLFSLPNVVWKNKYQTGFEVNAALGYSLKPCVRLEAEFLYQNFKRKISGSYNWREVNATTTELFAQNTGNPIHHASSTTNIYSLLSNIAFDYKNCTPLTLSLGGGVGVAWIESHGTERHHFLHVVTVTPPLDQTSPTLEKSSKLYGTAFAWQVKAGLKYDIKECFSIGLGYRLFGTTRFYASSSKIITNPGTSAVGVFKVPKSNLKGLLNNSVSLYACYLF